jgi:hypothetical protein
MAKKKAPYYMELIIYRKKLNLNGAVENLFYSKIKYKQD